MAINPTQACKLPLAPEGARDGASKGVPAPDAGVRCYNATLYTANVRTQLDDIEGLRMQKHVKSSKSVGKTHIF